MRTNTPINPLAAATNNSTRPTSSFLANKRPNYNEDIDNDCMFDVNADFDAYWEEEARNPNRNRIRIGRQYQATVPPLLDHSEKDVRLEEELETISFQPQMISDQELTHYMAVVESLEKINSYIKSSNNSHSNDCSINEQASTPCKSNQTQTISEASSSNNPDLPLTSLFQAKRLRQANSQINARQRLIEALDYFIAKLPVSDDQVKKTKSKPKTIDNTKTKNIDALMSVYNFDDVKEDSVPPFDSVLGNEVKARKAKPIVPNSSLVGEALDSNLGSLKFFMDGQLVLKLNACQQEQQKEKCQWVQSKQVDKSQSHESKRSGKKASSVQPPPSPNQTSYKSPMQLPLSSPVQQPIRPPNLPTLNYPTPWFPNSLAAAAAMLLSQSSQMGQNFQNQQKPFQGMPSASTTTSKPIDLSLDQHSAKSAKKSGSDATMSKNKSKKTVKPYK